MASWTEIKARVKSAAPAIIAAGDITAIRADFELGKEQDLTGIDNAISMAFPLPRAALQGCKEGPTLLYKHTYAQINYLMDRVALDVSLLLQESGHRAIAIPASQITSWTQLRAHVNHRQVAVHLGLGWYGRNNLLCTTERGCQVRLVTILTDAPLLEPGPWSDRKGESGCGECRRCLTVCPVNAIKETSAGFDLPACAAKTKEFEKVRGIGQRICGVCVRACLGPLGGK